MTNVDRERVYRLFAEAMEIDDAARDEFVLEQCRNDAEMLREVAALLAAAETDSGATGLLLGGEEPAPRDLSGEEYGRFRLLESIGSGGMGIVYRAMRTDGVPQAVAVKLLRGAISAESGARFIREAKLLARLDDPAIARLIDVGVKNGEGWLAVELVRGRPIDQYCEAHQLDLRERVKLLAVIAGAVATAHRSLVVHRDIKPTNVLVDEDGRPKLIDFGIASALTESSDPREATSDIRRLFTPHFAAPEQVKGEPVTVATDVFGLGALGYRLLSGKLPFAQAATPVTYLYAVTQEDLQAPSVVAEAVDLGRSRQLRGDLDAILMKALERDPRRRYLSALEFQADLHRYLDGLPVSAHAPSLRYRVSKFARRHTLVVALGAVLALGLLIGGVIYGLQARKVDEARDMAARRGEFLANMLTSADPHKGRRDITVAELLDSAAKQLDRNLKDEPLVEASMLGLIADTNRGLGRYPEALAANARQVALLKDHGAPSLDIARALIARGNLLTTSAKYAEAKPALSEALARLGRLSGSDADYAVTLYELGRVAHLTGDETQAGKLYRDAIAMDQRGNDAMHRNMADPQQNLSVLLTGLGRYPEAADASREAIATMQKYYPADYPELLIAESGLALELMAMHRAAQAEPVLRDVLARSTRVNGPEHPDVLVEKTQLGETLVELGRYTEAIEILRPTAESLERVLGPTDHYTTGTWSDYARASCSGPDPADGLAVAHRLADIRAKTLPADDWHQSNTQVLIGFCLTHLRRYAEAVPILRKGMTELEARRGASSYNTQFAYQSLHDLYLAMGQTADAQSIAEKIKQ